MFQPLISMDKDEIVRLAQRMGTFDLSNLPYKDCCSLMSKKPKTNVAVAQARALEAALDLPSLIPPTLSDLSAWDGEKLHPVTLS